MTRISVIVLAGDRGLSEPGSHSVENTDAWLRRTLQDFTPWREARHEIVVVAAASDQAGGSQLWYQRQVDQCFDAAGGRASRMNAGAASANGDVLLFLRAGTRLPVGALTAVNHGLQQSGRTWGRFDVQLDGQRDALRWVEWLANRHSRLTGVAMGEQAIFVRRDLFRLVGGFADLPILEDVDLCRRLKPHGPPLCLRDRVLVASEPWEQGGLGKNLKGIVGLRLAYFLGESPVELYRRYYEKSYGKSSSASVADVPVYRYPAARVLLWAQAPVLGEVKPQLQSQLGRSRVLQLYRQLTHFVWSQTQQRHLAPAEIWVSEPGCEAFFDELCPRKQQFLQQGNDQGTALLHAVQNALQDAEHVIIVTADFASLDVAYLQCALQALDDGVKVVIGPADDGSCGLLGLSSPLFEGIFENVDWGTDQTLAQIRQRLQTAEVQWVELPTRWRVETPEDLKRLNALHDWQRARYE